MHSPPGKLSAAAAEAGTCEPQTRRARWVLRSIPWPARRDPSERVGAVLAQGGLQGPRGPLTAREKFHHLCNLLEAN